MQGISKANNVDKLQEFRDWIHDRYWEAKEAKFPHAPEMQSFANGVEHAYSDMLIEANKRLQALKLSDVDKLR